MGLLLDLAVVLLAVGVAVSLGLLAWTLGISAGGRIWAGIRRTRARRERLATLERDMRAGAREARERLERLSVVTRRQPRRQEDGTDR